MKVVSSNSSSFSGFVLPSQHTSLSFKVSSNTRMGGELKFSQRWEFRRKDDEGFDSSSNDSQSNSTGVPILKEHKMVSGWISLDNDETSKLQPSLNNDSGFEGQFQFEKVEEKKIKSKRNNLASSELKKDSDEELNKKKSKTSAYDLVAVSDVKSFTESLLEELRASREKLFTWMREEMNKLIADDTGSTKRRKGASRGRKVQSQHRNKSEKNISVHSQKNFGKNLKFQHKNVSEESLQEKHLNGNGTVIHMQQQNNFEDTEVERQNNFDPNCNSKSLESFVKRTKATAVNDHCQALADQIDYGKATESITSVEKEKEERLALASNSKFRPNSSDQSVIVQHPKSVVLAIQAQNCNDGSSKRSAAGKKRADSNKLNQVPEDRTGYSRSMASCEKDKAKRLKLPVEEKFTLNISHHAASSMYLTLPTVSTEAPDLNRKLDNSSCNFFQPRVEGSKTTVNLEWPNQMLDFSSHCGYLPSIKEEKRGGNFAQMGSRNTSPFYQNSILSSSSGIGFPIPLHQGRGDVFSSPPGQFYFETVPRENGNTLGLKMNGGASTFSGGNLALSDHLVADSIYSHPNYKADTRFLPYEIPSTRDGYLFPK